jgi:chemotaxis protein histidine kinase CheA
MKAAECLSPGVARHSPPDDRFEELRDAFYARLRSDRERLTTLAAALTHAEGDAARIFEDIQLFAHRVGGAAAIFDASEVGIAANALERAAGSASTGHAANSDASVRTALETLVDLLGATAGKPLALPHAKKVRSRPDSNRPRVRKTVRQRT